MTTCTQPGCDHKSHAVERTHPLQVLIDAWTKDGAKNTHSFIERHQTQIVAVLKAKSRRIGTYVALDDKQNLMWLTRAQRRQKGGS